MNPSEGQLPRLFYHERKGLLGGERALVICLSLAIILLAGHLLSAGSDKAARDARRALSDHQAGGAWAMGQAIHPISAQMATPSHFETPAEALRHLPPLRPRPMHHAACPKSPPRSPKQCPDRHGPDHPPLDSYVGSEQGVQREVQRRSGEDNYYIHTDDGQTYFKSGRYLLRIEGWKQGNRDASGRPSPEAARVVGVEDHSGEWTYDFGARNRDLVVLGTGDGSFGDTNAFPHGIRPGTLVVGSAQTYGITVNGQTVPNGGQLSDPALYSPKAVGADAERIAGLYSKYDGPGTPAHIYAHSAGTVPAELLVDTVGGEAYLFGTPAHRDADSTRQGRSLDGAPETVHIINNPGDPVTDILNEPWKVVIAGRDICHHDYSNWELSGQGACMMYGN